MSQQNYQQAPYVLTPVDQKSKSEKRNCLRWIIGCSIGIFVLCCILPIAAITVFSILAGIADSNKITDKTTQTLPISDAENITLDVSNTVGETRIVGDSSATEITVEIVKTATGLSKDRAQQNMDKLKADVQKDGDRYIIDASGGDKGVLGGLTFGENSVTLRITVPSEVAYVVADTKVGALIVDQVIVTQDLKLTNDVGSIEFYGTLAAGDHTITSNVGGIKVTLTKNSSVEVSAKSDVGDISVDSGMLTNQDKSSEGAGQQLTGTYGEDDPAAGTLTIRSDVGSINLRER